MATLPPVRRSTSTCSTVCRAIGLPAPALPPEASASASSMVAFSGTRLPARRPSSAVITSFGAAITKPVCDARRREAGEHHNMHGADACARQHGDGALRHHRQVDRDPVALAYAKPAQRIGKAADLGMQLPVRQDAAVILRLALPDQRIAVAMQVEMAIQAVDRDIQDAVGEPADPHVAVEAAVVGKLWRPDPVEPSRLFLPEAVRIGDGMVRHQPVARSVDHGGRSQVRLHVVDRCGFHVAVAPEMPCPLIGASAASAFLSPPLPQAKQITTTLAGSA